MYEFFLPIIPIGLFYFNKYYYFLINILLDTYLNIKYKYFSTTLEYDPIPQYGLSDNTDKSQILISGSSDWRLGKQTIIPLNDNPVEIKFMYNNKEYIYVINSTTEFPIYTPDYIDSSPSVDFDIIEIHDENGKINFNSSLMTMLSQYAGPNNNYYTDIRQLESWTIRHPDLKKYFNNKNKLVLIDIFGKRYECVLHYY
jgi:hypothetical protein